jgi:FKBP-type peptidyl-prolyl cis-trans isomerase FkpA
MAPFRAIIDRAALSPGVHVRLTGLFRSAFTLVALGALAAAVAGCNNSPTAPSDYAPFSSTDLQVGTGADAISGSVVTVNYTGWLYSASTTDHKGLEFDSSIGRTTFTFTLGAGTVIPGWERGVLGMKVGGLRRLVIPPSLAYGGTRTSAIPPYATLLFEIEMVGVE